MEQTAVEFLYKQLESIIMDYNQKRISAEQAINSRAEALESAKELEKQQKGYSEEEVQNILIEYVKTNPKKPYRVVGWFEKFKNN